MASPTLEPAALSPRKVQRIRSCGRPQWVTRLSGEQGPSVHRCYDRFCEECSDRRLKKGYACIMQALEAEDGDDVYMVTLTRRSSRGRTEGALRNAVRRARAQWSNTTSRLRWDDYRRRRYLETGDGKYLAELREAGIKAAEVGEDVRTPREDCEPVDTMYDDGAGLWEREAADRTYIWALEATRGNSGGWHVHRHVVVPDLVTAQRIVAAHASYNDTIQGGDPYTVDIRHWDREHASAYLAGEMTKSGKSRGGWEAEAESLSVTEQIAWVRGLKGVRRHGAAGRWRPLGISPDPADDPPVLIHDGSGTYDASTYYSHAPYRSASSYAAVCDVSSVHGPSIASCSGVNTKTAAIPVSYTGCGVGRKGGRRRTCSSIKQSACESVDRGPPAEPPDYSTPMLLDVYAWCVKGESQIGPTATPESIRKHLTQ